MTMKSLLPLLSIAIAFLALNGLAQVKPTNSATSAANIQMDYVGHIPGQFQNAFSKPEISRPWLVWGLTESDWNSYTKIMEGPRATWSPDISPVSALGIHAKTDIDRMKYAEIAARQDWERLMSERAWYLTYEIARERYFSTQLKALSANQPSLTQLKAHDRLVLFTNDQCNPVCRRILTHLLSIGASVDIYFVGVSDREIISQWAKSNQIPPERVNSTKQITLNIDTGFFQRITMNSALPQLFRRDSEKNQLVEVTL